jgi:phosphohistidine swiveling domain-containing protein
MASWVVPLHAVGAGDVGLAGGKGANLGELVHAGFAVPDGFVVTTRSYALALRSAGLDPAAAAPEPAELQAAISTLTLPPELEASIVDAYRDRGEGAVAVRSSATAEDLPGAAFAGQQETFLNVVGREALLDAVRACWASLWAERAVAYRVRLAYADVPEIAVVVQRMVPSEHAGVLFTADPVTGARDRVVIEASPGLGEAVVSGLVTPEHVVVDRHGHVVERRPGRHEVVIRGRAGGGVHQEQPDGEVGAMPAGTLRDLAATGRRVAAHFGRPQDIEWAYADHTLWVVQARPLTALPPAPIRVGALRGASGAICAELLPVRPYPLDLTSWTVPGWFAILARMAAEIAGVRVDVGRMFPTVDGVLTELRPPDPRPSWRTLTTPLRLRASVRRFVPGRWTADPRFATYERRVGELQAHDPADSTWSDLLTVPGTVLGLLDAYVDLRIDYLGTAVVDLLRLRVLLALLGLSAELWPLLAGAPTRTRAANDALADLAAQVRDEPEWSVAFRASSDDELVIAVWHAEAYGPLREAVQAWLAAYGHRETTSAALVSSPTWAEEPALLLGNLRALVSRPPEPGGETDQAAAALQRVRRRRRVRVTHSAERVRRAADAARAAVAFREDSHFHALRIRPVLRSTLLEVGDRLTRAGALEGREEVFHLELAELVGLGDPVALDAEEARRLRALVRRRAARRAELGLAPLISPATLYPGARRPARDALVSGSPGGGGRATGPVRIVREPAEFGRLQPGEVLVCPYTNPAWTPLFSLASAVVADSGSFGSHAAIVAREYGIPAVMGTGNGTSALTDGQVVVVDGDRGDVVAGPGADARG